MSDCFTAAFHMGQFCDIDEQSIPFKGRHLYRYFNPNKPHKFHFKLFALNDTATGYMKKFYFYTGADGEKDDSVEATTRPVKVLFGDVDEFRNKNLLL